MREKRNGVYKIMWSTETGRAWCNNYRDYSNKEEGNRELAKRASIVNSFFKGGIALAKEVNS